MDITFDIKIALGLLSYFRRGALGYTGNRKTEENFIQNRKTANKIGQNRKPHTKQSKPDTMASREAYRANYADTNFIKVYLRMTGTSLKPS